MILQQHWRKFNDYTKDFSIASVYERTVVPKYMYDIILHKPDKLVNVLDK
jgi:hypothetical protein